MTFPIRATALAVALVAISAAPSFAQRGDRRHDGDRHHRQGSYGERRAVPRGRYERPRTYVAPYSYYRPYARRSYVVPYGYRPYGYRPGWNLNLYFGRPYGRAYGSGYGPGAYGYYGVVPGRAYGAVRIVDAPRDAQVYVDGYYAGVVDDYDGVFQHLNVEAGSHRIEIELPGYPADSVDVYVQPGQTFTYRARLP